MPETFLPSIHGDSITAQSDAVTVFVEAWMKALGERASIMRQDSRLMRCAELHALYLASRTPEEIEARKHLPYAMHLGRDGSTANERVRASGYRLLDYYPLVGNNVESCSRSTKDPATVAADLAAHDEHHDHMMGIGSFARQTVYGIGNVGDDYVVVTAPPEP